MFKLAKLKMNHFNTKSSEYQNLKLPYDLGEYCLNQTSIPILWLLHRCMLLPSGRNEGNFKFNMSGQG